VVPLIIIGLGRVSGLWSAYGALDTISDLAFLFLLVLGAASGWHSSKRKWRGAILGGLVAIVVGLIVTVLKVVLEH
jgi:VIT1/CCC1 family predicted Fe2+/Mn2+ transporter